MNEKERDDELKNTAPHLSQWRQRQQERQEDVPNDYFQNFEARLQQRLATEQALTAKTASPSPSWARRWATWWRPTAWVLAPALALLVWWNTAEPVPGIEEVPTFAELSEGELSTYVEQNIETFTTQELAAVLDEDILEPELIVVEDPEEETAPAEEATSAAESLDRALEETELDDLLDDLSIEELEGAEDWL